MNTNKIHSIIHKNSHMVEFRFYDAEYCSLMTGQGNERDAPETFIKEEANMKYDPELASLLAQT